VSDIIILDEYLKFSLTDVTVFILCQRMTVYEVPLCGKDKHAILADQKKISK